MPNAVWAMYLPAIEIAEEFADAITDHYGDEGRRWLHRLPAVVMTCAERWGLELGESIPGGHAGHITSCRDKQGRDAVLKVAFDTQALMRECDALNHWRPSGRVPRVFADDVSAGVLLLERIQPGPSLNKRGVDSRRAQGCVRLITELHAVRGQPPRCEPMDIAVTRRLGVMMRRLPGCDKRVRASDVEKAMALAGKLLAHRDRSRDTALHGDLNGGNIVIGPRGRLFAIDPQPITGEVEFEAALCAVQMRWDRSLVERAKLFEALPEIDTERLYCWVRVLAVERAVARSYFGRTNDASLEDLLRFSRAR